MNEELNDKRSRISSVSRRRVGPKASTLGGSAIDVVGDRAIAQTKMTRIGYRVKTDLPMQKGHVVGELYRRGARWLAGGALEQ